VSTPENTETKAAATPEASPLPTWLREVDNALVIAPHVVITGNVLDYHLVSGQLVHSVPEALWHILEPAGYEFLLLFDPIESAVSLLPDNQQTRAAALEVLGTPMGEVGSRASIDLGRCMSSVQESSRRAALAVEQASRLLLDPQSPNPEVLRQFQLAERLATTVAPNARDGGASLYNVCFWIARSERDLPDWFASSNPRVRLVAIPEPDAASLRVHISQLARARKGKDAELTEEDLEMINKAVDATVGMQLRAVEEINQLAKRHGFGFEGFPDAARAYRVGISDSPWQQSETRDRVLKAPSVLSTRVLGQEAAIRRSLDILARSVTGLTGAQTSGLGQRPRGVLFFAGPTGVGKTELAKALTELIFGSEDRYHRFDMSEFRLEQAEARLIGAPPGYVGHGSGGELTNAMRRQPFSVVLFDEIEKAHPRILDKFLQILDDGRLTDGAGATVYFTEAILIFTSNLGMDHPLDDGTELADAPPGLMESVVRERIQTHFREELGRPELLNRLGDNIVVFRFITPEVANGIFSLCLDRIAARVESAQGVELEIADGARETLRAHATGNLSMGGRGILNALESALVNPLARYLFEKETQRGETVTVEAVRETLDGWELEIS
jgi:ATP-dependent Clp protease ATP-binding subunit ClpB